MKHIYIVIFEIQRQCKVQEYVYHCEAQNAKDAVAQAREHWVLSNHQFHIHAVKSRVQDGNLLRVLSVNGKEHKGTEVIGLYIMTDSRTWRINGRNLYA